MPMPGGGSVARQPVFANNTLTITSRGRNPLNPDGKTADYRGNTASFVMGAGHTDVKWRRVAGAGAANLNVVAHAMNQVRWVIHAGNPWAAGSDAVTFAWNQIRAAIAAGDPNAATLDEVLEAAPPLPSLLKSNGLSEGAGPADVRLAWDAGHLYVSATIKATDLVASNDPEDARAGSAFTLLLDPRRDGSAVYEFTVTPDGNMSFATHPALGVDLSDLKNKPILDRIAAQQKQLAWWPKWSAVVRIDGKVRLPGEAPNPHPALWHVEMAIPLDDFPKTVAKPQPNGIWRMNVLLNESVGNVAGKPMIKTWALCPPTASEPLGPILHWPAGEFQAAAEVKMNVSSKLQ